MVTVLGVVGVAAPARATAQDGTLILEGGTTRALPPSDVALDPATYALGGLRGGFVGARGSISGGAYGGRATGGEGSDFLSGVLGGELWLGSGSSIALGVGGSLQGFAVREPLLYRVSAAEVSPMLRFGTRVPLVIRGRFGTGTSRVELHRADGTVRRAEHDLWNRGVDAELTLGSADFAVTGIAGLQRSHGGSFRELALRAVAAPGRVTVRGTAELWDTPDGSEFSGGISLSIGVGRLEARASADRTGPDPLTLVEPGRQTGFLVGIRLLSRESGRRGVVHEVVRAGNPARVRVHVAPPAAGTVELLADFSDWAPVPLERDGAEWATEVDLEPGTYHFGFLVDGEWWVPEGLQGTVPDEWGRMNATMVVADNEEGP